MEDTFDILKAIKKADVPDYLYENILKKVELQKKGTINIAWVRAAAAVIICMISVEVYLVRDSFIQKEKTSIQSLLPTNNNMLY